VFETIIRNISPRLLAGLKLSAEAATHIRRYGLRFKPPRVRRVLNRPYPNLDPFHRYRIRIVAVKQLVLHREARGPPCDDASFNDQFFIVCSGPRKICSRVTDWYSNDSISIDQPPCREPHCRESRRGAVIKPDKIAREINNLGSVTIPPFNSNDTPICPGHRVFAGIVR
jgi:hypothetical protein